MSAYSELAARCRKDRRRLLLHMRDGQLTQLEIRQRDYELLVRVSLREHDRLEDAASVAALALEQRSKQ